ncbi:MAG TPA: hypothetical protein PK770_02770 [Kiritimatiellia bacterium]|nr:hypothetical protein [Kiritimatiellia bacterium]
MRSCLKARKPVAWFAMAALSVYGGPTSIPIRQGGVEGRPFWNKVSPWFEYAPAFDFPEVNGAVKYRFIAKHQSGAEFSFEAESPQAALSPIWEKLPVGAIELRVAALDANGGFIGTAPGDATVTGSAVAMKPPTAVRKFWKKATFHEGMYESAACSYAQSARKAFEFVLNEPSIRYLHDHGTPDPSYSLNGYPSKMLSAEIGILLDIAKTRPEHRAFALETAKKAADHLIRNRCAAGTPLEYFTKTYEGEGEYGRSKQNAGLNMLIYPAKAGEALVKLHVALARDEGYLDAAEKIAATYLKLQGTDGTWPLKVREDTGEPVAPNRLIPLPVIDFLESLYAVTKKPEYRAAANRAFAYVEKGPLKTWNWEGQFEDTKPRPPYLNPTMHEAASTAIYLLKRFPGDAKRLELAMELVRWAEDQFVAWEKPEVGDRRAHHFNPANWYVPGTIEQLAMGEPIDASSAKMIEVYLALHKATGGHEYWAKARVLGDTITRAQWEDGCYKTFWVKADRDDQRYHVWMNCHIYTARVMNLLATVEHWLNGKPKRSS